MQRLLAYWVVAFGVALPAAARADVNYVFYTAEKVQWGSAEHSLVLPRTFSAPADMTASALASEAFHRLKSYRGSAFSDAALALDPNFASTGAATVTCGAAAQRELHVVVSEAYWTLLAAGVREIRIPEVKKDALTDLDVPLGTAGIVVQLWQVLPPGTPGPGLVRLAGGLEHAHVVRQKLAAGEKTITAAVLGLLASPLAYVRLQAIAPAAKMGTPAAEAALLPLLHDADPGVKKAVIQSFEGTKSKKALTALEQVVQADPDPTMKSAAVRILNAAGITKFEVFLLFDKLKDPDDGVVMDAIDKLSKGGKPEVAMALVDVLTHRNAQVQDLGMKAIVGLNNVDAIRKIVETDTIGMRFRNQAARILAAGSAEEDADRGLRHLILNGSASERATAIEDVAKRRRYKLVTDVVGALADSEPGVRHAAAGALGQIKDSKALAPLAEALRKNAADQPVMEAAIIAIFGGLSLDEVIKASEEKDATLRQLSIKSLAKFAEGDRPNPRVIEVLSKRLSDTDKEIRRSAAFALARITDPAVVGNLLALKDDPDGTIREQVATAVAASKHAEADAILLKFLDDSDNGAKRAAIEGLRNRKVKSALQKLRFLVTYRDDAVRRAVMRAVVDLAGPEDWEGFFQIWSTALFDTDAEVKIQAVKGISARRDPRVPGLLAPLASDQNVQVQIAALAGLGATGDPAAVEYIAGALTDPQREVKVAALEALRALNIEPAKKPLQDFIRNESDKDLVEKANAIFDALP